MPRATSSCVGRMACVECGHPVRVRSNDKGTLAYTCGECDLSPFVRTTDAAHRRWMDRIKPDTGPAPAPGPSPAPAKKPDLLESL